MAIKVNGTTVIDDSRNLSNVGGLKTVGGTSILGSGDISTGASTSFGAVGTYTLGYDTGMASANGSTTGYKAGRTASGSAIRGRAALGSHGDSSGTATSTSGTNIGPGSGGADSSGLIDIGDNNSYSGSWRMMSPGANRIGSASSSDWNGRYTALWVRYS